MVVVFVQIAACDKSLDEDIEELANESDDEDEEKEPFAKRQLNTVRDTVKNAFGSGYKYISNGRLVKGVSSAITAVRPSVPGSLMNNFLKAVRTGWNRQSEAASAAVLKQLEYLGKRISNSKLIIGNLGARLSNREESATKNTKADTAAAPTALPKSDNQQVNSTISSSSSLSSSSSSSSSSSPSSVSQGSSKSTGSSSSSSNSRNSPSTSSSSNFAPNSDQFSDYLRKLAHESNKGVYVMPPPSFTGYASADAYAAYASPAASVAIPSVTSASMVTMSPEPSNSLPSIYNMNHMYGLHVNPMYEQYPLYPPVI